jgi:endonuclease/exonuclease/phosphatase family metal-dependent hydrolase
MYRTTTFARAVCLGAALLVGCSSGRFSVGGRALRVMTFNLNHGEGTDGKFDIDRIADVINESDADVVALQEVDRWVPRSGKIDMMSKLSDLTGMTYAFSQTGDLDSGVTGNGLLTRFPILEEKSVVLEALRAGTEHAMMELVLDVRGIEIVFVNTEFSGESDDTTRIANVARIQAEVRQHGFVPAIVCGSLNTDPSSRCIGILAENFLDCWNIAGTGPGFTYPSASAQHRLDYIFVSKSQAPADSKTGRSDLKITSARVVATDGSDHLPVILDLNIVSE